MPWKGVTVTEERQRFLEDYRLNYYSVSELAERFGISRKTGHPGLRLGQASGSPGTKTRGRMAIRSSSD
jgi:transposase-like protein